MICILNNPPDVGVVDTYKFEPSGAETQYNALASRPDFGTTLLPDWTNRSAGFRSATRCVLDVAYGPGARETLDVFPTSDSINRATVVYFHGGYWQRGDKSLYSFIAEPYVKNGVSVVLVNYDLCPTSTITEITAQARSAFAWIWCNASNLGLSAERLFVMGHSAGAQIACMVMAAEWAAIGPNLPTSLARGGIAISGIYELEPLRFTSMNDAIQLDQTEAHLQSPVNYISHLQAPQLIVCGEKESEEFHRQADLYADLSNGSQQSVRRYTVPNCDHFDILNELSKEGSELFKKTLCWTNT